jgi:polynucleotide 5'-hydroxyl-kinase GRC3/NOL9
MEIIPGPEWETLLSTTLKVKGAVMIMGTTDSGKTTLARYLITHLLTEGVKVSLVDTDVGQTSLGLPGTISMKVFPSLEDLEDFIPDRMFFVGVVNPATAIPLIIRTAGTAVGKCREKSDIVLMDTSGLVSGRIGEVLKTGKIRAVRPEHIIAVQREDEIEHILRLAGDIDISRVVASGTVKKRDTGKRIRYREKKYESYFREVQQAEYLVDLRDTGPFYKGREMSPGRSGFPKGNVIGLNRGDETLALGLLTEIAEDRVTFKSRLGSLKGINRIVFGDISYTAKSIGHSA